MTFRSTERANTTPHILIAPDKFKGSLSASSVAAAIVEGLRAVWGTDRVTYDRLPMADGGDGTVAAFLETGAVPKRATVRGPLGDPVRATYARSRDVAIIEMATASGLALMGPVRNPLYASTFGTGELIRDALDGGARRIVLGLGGSATTDGGAGALAALGARFIGSDGTTLLPYPAGLATLAAIDLSRLDPRLARTPISLACDVQTRLLGPRGAAAVFGPQKGATAADVADLEAFLARFADLACDASGRDLRAAPGAGAAGGLGFGLATCLGAALSGGFAIVAELRDFDAHLRGAALCITGEGRIDRQTLEGKVVDGVAAAARRAGVEVVAFGGSVDPVAETELWARGIACVPIAAGPIELDTAMRRAPLLIRDAAARFARLRPAPV